MSENQMPDNLHDFTLAVIEIIKNIKPQLQLDFKSDGEITANGQRIDVNNLFKIAQREKSHAKIICQTYMENLLSSVDKMNDDQKNKSFLEIKDHIMPRIHSNEFFHKVDQTKVAHIPFVNETSIVFVHDMPNATSTITTDMMIKWNVSIEDIEIAARDNLKKLEINNCLEFIESKEKGMVAIICRQDGYDSSRILLDDLYSTIYPHMPTSFRRKSYFYVGIPARDTFVAISTNSPALIRRMADRIKYDYDRMPYPISGNLFVVTRDGVAAADVDIDLKDEDNEEGFDKGDEYDPE